MADPARELVRDAQAAEVRGDKPAAVTLLVKAATLYRGRGQPARALQMLRHAARLSPGDDALSEEIARLSEEAEPRPSEFLPGPDEDEPPFGAAPTYELSSEGEEDRPGLSSGFQRVMTLAPEALGAWCSFCCRPATEVGQLVAGPAAAYICRLCATEATDLIDGVERTVPSGAPILEDVAPAAEAAEASGAASAGQEEEAARAAVFFVGQEQAVRVLEVALRLDARVVLLLGPEGSGKSTYLRRLAATGHGVYADGSDLPAMRPGQRLLWDNLERRSPAEMDTFLSWLRGGRERRVLVALRGRVPPRSVRLESDEVELELHSTQALLEATDGLLPVELAESVQVVAHFRPLEAAELREIARHLVARRVPPLHLDPNAVDMLIHEAAGSGRGGRELEALVDRLPAGRWSLNAAKGKVKSSPKSKSKGPAKQKAGARPKTHLRAKRGRVQASASKPKPKAAPTSSRPRSKGRKR